MSLEKVICYPATQVTSNGIWAGQKPSSYSLPLLLMQISSVLIISRGIQILLKPLKQPAIISEIMGGIIVGPAVLGRLKGIRNILFPDQGYFVLNTVSMLGVIFYQFMIGVKMNPSLIGKGRKSFIIALTGMIVTFATVTSLIYPLGKYVSKSMAQGPFLTAIASQLTISPFPDVYPFLAEFNLLNSELGRLSLAAAMVNDIIGWSSLVLLETTRPGRSSLAAFYSLGSNICLLIFAFFIIHPLMIWIIRQTPEGKPVEQRYVVTILMGAVVMALTTDMLGMSLLQGPLLFGLVIPDGPPLGSTLTDKTEMMMRVILLPLFFACCGQSVTTFSITDWRNWGVLVLIIFISRIAKLAGTIFSAIICKINFRDALTLGLILNSKGFTEMLTYWHWISYTLIDDQTYTQLVASTLVTTSIVSPLVKSLTMNSRPYMTYVRRTIQHLNPRTELRMLACIHGQENVPPIINLLEATHATQESPICVYVMHLVELIGRATPMLIAHKPHKKSTFSSISNAIFSAFYNYEKQYTGNVVIQPFTSIAPYKTTHNDVCSVALDKKVCLIIVPFHKQKSVDGSLDVVDHALQLINPNVLVESPCSVGILVDRSRFGGHYAWSKQGSTPYRICVIFIGGADDREALSYASRMVNHPRVMLTVVRFLSKEDMREKTRERWLDDELVEEFRVKSVGNEQIVYREELVMDVEETISVIQSMDDIYDLMVVGRRQGMTMWLVGGPSVWSENPELGVIGDLCCSSDFFSGTVSVLVMQQQVITSVSTIDDILEFNMNHGHDEAFPGRKV
ncbi:cation/H(+) antiporter 15-like [Magnolia sinica]|uniref:cation/H(+) antiporter 15-like n=1 Tax=Magnolia sinica TaxID=86752 RepID=UPI00265985D4|nr:cation/H(+) antiporter 15-like [Magnolia sinica]